MSSPWLFLPLEDYEGHIASPGVQPLSVLAELFKRALDYCLPESVAVLGVAGGNGLEQVDYTATERVPDTLPQKCQKEIPEKSDFAFPFGSLLQPKPTHHARTQGESNGVAFDNKRSEMKGEL